MPTPVNRHDDRPDAIPDITTEAGRTDLANAERFAHQHAGKLIFCHPWRTWLVWDGCRWLIDVDGRAITYAMETARALFDEAVGKGQYERQFAASSASKRGLDAMLSLAGSLMPVSTSALDADPWLLNCPNGTVNLRTGELRDHDPGDHITKVSPTPYVPDAQSGEWYRFLDDISCGDSGLIQFLRQFAGMSLTGDVSEQIFVILHGDGANGKTTFMNLLMETLGRDYCKTAASKILVAKKHDAHPTERADLFGARLVNVSETERDDKLAESFVKAITGSESIWARRCFKDGFEFRPTHKLVLQTNHRPKIEGTDFAIQRRIRLVPFNARFDGASRDNRITERLMEHRESILAWAMRGCLEWRRAGKLCCPSSVASATEEYIATEDRIGQFIRERCVPDGDVRFRDFASALATWSGTEWKSRNVSSYLRKQGFKDFTNDGLCFKGISLA